MRVLAILLLLSIGSYGQHPNYIEFHTKKDKTITAYMYGFNVDSNPIWLKLYDTIYYYKSDYLKINIIEADSCHIFKTIDDAFADKNNRDYHLRRILVENKAIVRICRRLGLLYSTKDKSRAVLISKGYGGDEQLIYYFVEE